MAGPFRSLTPPLFTSQRPAFPLARLLYSPGHTHGGRLSSFATRRRRKHAGSPLFAPPASTDHRGRTGTHTACSKPFTRRRLATTVTLCGRSGDSSARRPSAWSSSRFHARPATQLSSLSCRDTGPAQPLLVLLRLACPAGSHPDSPPVLNWPSAVCWATESPSIPRAKASAGVLVSDLPRLPPCRSQPLTLQLHQAF
jgi:hypothetical protein